MTTPSGAYKPPVTAGPASGSSNSPADGLLLAAPPGATAVGSSSSASSSYGSSSSRSIGVGQGMCRNPASSGVRGVYNPESG